MLPLSFIILAALGKAMAIEEPSFSVESKVGHYEVRSYQKTLVAETSIDANFENAGNKAFRILADYIFGDNKAKEKISMTAPVTQIPRYEKISMTAPVTQRKTQEGFLVQFTMPRKYSIDTIPAPNDARVHLRTIPARKVAVYSYTGSWSEDRYNRKLAAFLSELKENGVNTVGDPVFARFNSPFQIWFLRRNEIWIELAN